jgi:uncharacterized protein
MALAVQASIESKSGCGLPLFWRAAGWNETRIVLFSRQSAATAVFQAITVCAIAYCLLLPLPASAGFPVCQLEIAGHSISVEVAHTHAARSRGLMFRHALGENQGMLFVFTEAGRQSMWMLNTFIPLSIAFLDKHGRIINIAHMIPNTRTPHSSAGPAKYALEMNHGWFAQRGIKEGMQVTGLEKLPEAE